MQPYIRNLLAIVAGVLAAFVLVGLIEALGHMVYPVPEGLDFTNPDQLQAYVQGLPVGALLFVLAAWVVATFVGGLVAASVARTRPLLYSTIVGAVVLAATIANLLMIPHPRWFAIAAVVAIPIAAFVAARLRPARASD